MRPQMEAVAPPHAGDRELSAANPSRSTISAWYADEQTSRADLPFFPPGPQRWDKDAAMVRGKTSAATPATCSR